MRKILTRLATLVLIVVVMISFSACSLFTVNLDKKYSPTIMVATAANNGVTVSRQELYYAYMEWGYQYAQQIETKELLEQITTNLLNNKILEQQSLELYGELSDSEIAYAHRQAFQKLNNTIRKYVYEALDVEDTQSNDESTDAAESEVDKPYHPSILVDWENGERVFMMDLSSYIDSDMVGSLSSADYTVYVPTIPGIASQSNAKQAISKIVRNLQTLEKGFTELKTPEVDYLEKDNQYFKHLSAAERAVLNREIDRIIRSNKTSIAVNRISTGFNLGFFTLDSDDAKVAWQDYLKRGENFTAWSNKINGINIDNVPEEDLPAYFGCGRAVATNIADEAIAYYLEKGMNAINNANNFSQSEDLESKLVENGLADVYYIPTDVANNLFTVSHILVGFTDEQKAELERINNEAEKNSAYNKQNDLNKLYAETSSNGVSAYNILLEVQTALQSADSLQEKYETFRDLINQYNSDPGMQNLDQLNANTNKPQYEYVMSSTTEKNQMVEPFTKASIELFNKGVKGAISGLVWTDYGAHIIMYTRNVSDFVYTGAVGVDSTLNLFELNYADTLFETLTSYGNRTLFDSLVDAYFTRNVSDHQNHRINDYRQDHEITIITSEFKKFL